MGRSVKVAAELLLERCQRTMGATSESFDILVLENALINKAFKSDIFSICALQEFTLQAGVITIDYQIDNIATNQRNNCQRVAKK